MEVVDRYGLALALIEARELADEPWLGADRPVDVVRVPDPPAASWAELAERGFVHKPSVLTWVSALGPDEDTHLAGLNRTARRSVRCARREAAAAGLREVVEDPVTPDSLDRFFALYQDRVSEMRFGVPFALDYRDVVLHGPRKFFGVFSYEGDEMAGGVLLLECPAVDLVVLRFSAVSARWRRSSLARPLYLAAMRAGRERGYSRASMGNEPNLLGHLTQPGLLRFKTALGFRAVPSQECADPQGGDEADLVLRLDALNDPTLILGYAGPAAGRPGRSLAGHLFCEALVDAELYHAPFLESLTVRAPGGPGRTPPA
ncbi:GNAT family N-acetyltransferase [Streptomyces sp. N2-109]|uniref:GNAT family N-acetyltransferase n=1 Tax=Streptomyces gossypii TaxID=2883101 RepID=A0ABT2JQ76_9ACTN|nr:GNAT family N-acetyltransferase [Streptomyces gossypii]MCT2589966.1 GNAT family N-acetyltransferase [Streptomyces gossypii]